MHEGTVCSNIAIYLTQFSYASLTDAVLIVALSGRAHVSDPESCLSGRAQPMLKYVLQPACKTHKI